MTAFGLVRYQGEGAVRLGVHRDGLVTALNRHVDLPVDADLADLWADWDGWVQRIAASAVEGGTPLDDLDLMPAASPAQLFQAGANYRQHVIDLAVAQQISDPGTDDETRRRRADERVDRRVREGLPYVFIGLTSSLGAGRATVAIPGADEQPDWEIELAVVLARGGRNVSTADALGLVGGYAIADDLTLRARVYRPDLPTIGTDWLQAKNRPGFTPLGPVLVPAAFLPDPSVVRLTLRLDGEVMQDSSADDMVFGVAAQLAYISRWAELRAGDVLLTGSPAGNGIHHGRLLRPGDVIEAEITGLGVQRTTFVAETP